MIPDRLVQAAAEALIRGEVGKPIIEPGYAHTVARIALAAAFAALPECEEVIAACRGSFNATTTIEYLAREFGEPTP